MPSHKKLRTLFRFKHSMIALSIGLFSSTAWADGCLSSDSEVSLCRDGDQPLGPSDTRRGGEVIIVDGESHIVDNNTDLNSYVGTNKASINIVNGSSVYSVMLIESSGKVHDSTVEAGVSISRGLVDVSNSVIENQAGVGLQLRTALNDLNVPTLANVVGSTVSGGTYGISVGPTGILNLSNTSVIGTGFAGGDENGGLRMTGGKAYISDNSSIVGDNVGLLIASGESGTEPVVNKLEINGSSVTGLKGAAIEINKLRPNNAIDSVADILVSNHSVLRPGNGLILNALNKSTANIEVNNSNLSGDMVADDSSTLNVVLRNHGRLNGNIINSNSLVIDSSGHWQMGGDNVVKSLAIDGGSIGFSEDGFHSLTVGELSGRGVFDMRINLANGTGDLLNVAGQANGRYRLRVQNTGVESVPSSFDALRVVHTEGGDAEFNLAGGRADLGVYSYELERQGTDWFIVGSGKIISPSTQSALALFNAAPTIWNSELTTLRSRMGEVRGQEDGGGWMRSYGNRFNTSLDSGVDYRQQQQGLSFGADAPIPVSEGHLMLGLMGGYSKSDLNVGQGTTGQVDSYYVGAYGTWLSDDGYYLDSVVKLNQFHNESKVAMSDGTKAKGDYSNTAVGGSVEFGKHIKLADEYFVEPFVQLSGVWIDGDSYTLDNGLQAKTSQTQSVLGKVGSTVGRSFALKDGGIVQPYARVALAHEFSRSNEVSVNDQRFDNDLFGSRAELGAGVSVSLSKRVQVHADFEYMKGEHVEQPWGANVGIRLAF